MNKEYSLALHSEIDGDRIYLRPLQLKDAEDMYEYASDEETTHYVFERHKSLEETKETLARFFIANPLGKYGIVLKENQKLIGTIELRVEADHKKAELGYTVNKAYWSKGYGTEAGSLILHLAFDLLELNRVFAYHDVRNAASGKVLQKLGMTYEGTFRNNRISKGEVITDNIYAMLREDYGTK